ncbi:unnamed protein product [Discosporangium mesarthrocarpum]
MFASPLFWQIRYLVTNLTKKNLKSSIAELNQLIALYGEDARLFLLQCLVEETGFKEQKPHAHHPSKEAQKIQLLQHEVALATLEPNFVSAICRALEGSAAGSAGRDPHWDVPHSHTRGRGGPQSQQGPHRVTEEFLAGFCRALKLSPPQQVAVALGLARSQNPAVSREGVKFLVAKVPGLANGGGHLSGEALHSLLELVNLSEGVAEQPNLARTLLEHIRESHRDLAQRALDGGGTGGQGATGGGSRGGGGGRGKSGSGGGPGGVGGGTSAGGAAAGAGAGAGGGESSLSSSEEFFRAEALSLVPLFVDQAEMNFLNRTGGAASLAADVGGIASSIGLGGISLAGFLRELGHSCCSGPATLRQAIRESGQMVDERQVAKLITMLAVHYKGGGGDDDLSSALTNSLFSSGEGQAQVKVHT